MLSVHATDGVQVLLAGLLDKNRKVFPKQQAEINGNGRQTPRPGEPKGLGLWPCYRKIHKWFCRTARLTDGLRADGRTDGFGAVRRTDGRRDRRTDGPTPTYRQTDAPTDRPTDRSTKRPANRPTDLVREWQVLHPPCPGHTACQTTTVTFILHCPAQIRVQRVHHRVPSGSHAALQPLRRRGATAIEAMWSTNTSLVTAQPKEIPEGRIWMKQRCRSSSKPVKGSPWSFARRVKQDQRAQSPLRMQQTPCSDYP